MITTLVLLGQVLELRARGRTSAAIRALLGLAPKTARVVRDGRRRGGRAARAGRAGRPAARAPGREGAGGRRACWRARAPWTSRWSPASRCRCEKGAGDAVIGGTVNGTGGFVMRAERVGADTLLAQIVRMVGEAQRSRAPIQRLADVVAGWFVPAVVAAPCITFVVWALVGPGAAPGLRAGERGRRADHRLPVRAGARHAHVDHGRRRARRACGRPDPQRRGARSCWRRWIPSSWTRPGR